MVYASRCAELKFVDIPYQSAVGRAVAANGTELCGVVSAIQVTSMRTTLEIPAFNPNKNKKEKERERRERRDREEHERLEAEARREARERRERERRDRDDRDRERRERERDERELRRPSKDSDSTNKQQERESRPITGYDTNESASVFADSQRGVGPTSLQKFNEQENGAGESGHLPNCRFSDACMQLKIVKLTRCFVSSENVNACGFRLQCLPTTVRRRRRPCLLTYSRGNARGRVTEKGHIKAGHAYRSGA